MEPANSTFTPLGKLRLLYYIRIHGRGIINRVNNLFKGLNILTKQGCLYS
jgi:hypothetical protein